MIFLKYKLLGYLKDRKIRDYNIELQKFYSKVFTFYLIDVVVSNDDIGEEIKIRHAKSLQILVDYVSTQSDLFIDLRDYSAYRTYNAGGEIWLVDLITNGIVSENSKVKPKGIINDYVNKYTTYLHTDIDKVCPEGTRLPNKKDFDNLLNGLKNHTINPLYFFKGDSYLFWVDGVYLKVDTSTQQQKKMGLRFIAIRKKNNKFSKGYWMDPIQGYPVKCIIKK